MLHHITKHLTESPIQMTFQLNKSHLAASRLLISAVSSPHIFYTPCTQMPHTYVDGRLFGLYADNTFAIHIKN